MGYVGTGQSGHTYIGSGIGASGTFKQMGTNSNLTAHGVVVAEAALMLLVHQEPAVRAQLV
jgi:hypothetical protein